MVSIESVDTCCRETLFGFDKAYGWFPEMLLILGLAFLFNFVMKKGISAIHNQLQKKGQFWHDSFLEAFYRPMSCFVWFIAGLQVIDLLSAHLGVPLSGQYHLIIVTTGVISGITWFFLRWKDHVVDYLINKSRNREITIDQGRIKAIERVITLGIIFFAALSLLEATGQNVSTLIAFGGIGGLALAIASQEIIANLFGGFMIQLTHPFTIGDFVSLPQYTIEGHVEEIGWYMTRLRSLDKRPIYIPNSIFSKQIVVTPSRMTHRQIKEKLGLRYCDLSKIPKITADLRVLLQNYADIDKKLPIIVNLTTFSEYSLDIEVNAYTRVTLLQDYMNIKEDVLIKIADLIAANGAEMAFPTQNISILNTGINPVG